MSENPQGNVETQTWSAHCFNMSLGCLLRRSLGLTGFLLAVAAWGQKADFFIDYRAYRQAEGPFECRIFSSESDPTSSTAILLDRTTSQTRLLQNSDQSLRANWFTSTTLVVAKLQRTGFSDPILYEMHSGSIIGITTAPVKIENKFLSNDWKLEKNKQTWSLKAIRSDEYSHSFLPTYEAAISHDRSRQLSMLFNPLSGYTDKVYLGTESAPFQVLIHTSFAQVHGCWSPDDRWIGIIDNNKVRQQDVIIYKFDRDPAPTVRKTLATGASFGIKFDLDSWDLDQGIVILNLTNQSVKTTVPLRLIDKGNSCLMGTGGILKWGRPAK